MDKANLIDMIDYQSDSVVSKEIIKKGSGSVTVFAFDKGQGLSEHTAPFDALVYVLDGEAVVTISGRHYDVKQGAMIIMPANEPHSISAVEKFKMFLVLIRE
ncbi:MAG: cupin domain-containing protein [Candidatus Omnitrophica bacterium]|nr:cupin domain-containing protein [Candidatus Omnitrophota bacterium]MBU0878256.1 cupin domain-containing protein [Candidatus Omnitrophota bacterium]MBU0896275.1 cupin domain-containing protein [Candidatus Omnitrophota bacterium]MBU1134424.1 cupin domain-containing protein [Candidatus Omnitrophota bacterium]MBU1367485.1 cupin domain-containing protein [Candidatus Omnitrophota bacterium]